MLVAVFKLFVVPESETTRRIPVSCYKSYPHVQSYDIPPTFVNMTLFAGLV